jgi:hypothetical protein
MTGSAKQSISPLAETWIASSLRYAPRNDVDGARAHAISVRLKSPPPTSRQLAFAAEPQPFFGFQLRHRQQMVEQVEPVAPGELGEFGNGLPDEGRGLIRAALPIRFPSWLPIPGFPIPARSSALPAVSNPAQKTCIRIYSVRPKNTPIPATTLGRISQLIGYRIATLERLFNICRFDRDPLNTHVRPETADASLAEPA